jgi:DNA-binding phage protein
MARKKTGFDRYFDKRMEDSAFASAYREERAIIDSTDALVRALDEARMLEGVSKAELARRIGARPEAMRRLLTSQSANPTLTTVVNVAASLGFHLELVPNRATG